MAVQLVNLTPTTVTIWPKGRADQKRVYPPSGTVARIRWFERVVTALDGVDIVFAEPSSFEGIPEPKPGVRFIVYESVCRLVEDRKDFLFPFGVIKAGDGSKVHRELWGWPKLETEKFYARLGFATGKPLEEPVKCKRCGCWEEEKDSKVGVLEGKVAILCRRCDLEVGDGKEALVP